MEEKYARSVPVSPESGDKDYQIRQPFRPTIQVPRTQMPYIFILLARVQLMLQKFLRNPQPLQSEGVLSCPHQDQRHSTIAMASLVVCRRLANKAFQPGRPFSTVPKCYASARPVPTSSTVSHDVKSQIYVGVYFIVNATAS